MAKPRVYSVDIDGTLTKTSAWTEEQCLTVEPRPEVIAKINELSKTNFIVIHTARRHELYLATIQWLNTHGVRYHAISMGKMPCDVIFDLDAINDYQKL